MTNDQPPTPDVHQPPVYTIKIKGHLGPQWMNWFEGLTITLQEDGNTLLHGPMVDQAALHGVLRKIRDLGLPLLSVDSSDREQSIKLDTDKAQGDPT